MIYNHVGLLDEALQRVNRAIHVNPLNPKAHWTKGIMLTAQSEYQADLDAWSNAMFAPGPGSPCAGKGADLTSVAQLLSQ